MVKINLHSHSNYSDGKDSIEVLVTKMQSLDYFSITDHDNVKSVSYILDNYKFSNYVNGVELTSYCDENISGFDFNYALHILAYDFDPDLMDNYLKNWSQRRSEVIRNLLHKTKNFNNQVQYTESRTELAKQFVKIGLVKDFISGVRKINLETKGESNIPRVYEVIEAIHACKGYAIWAHPFIILEHSNHVELTDDQVKKMTNELARIHLDGIESEYGLFSQKQQNFLNDLAVKHDFITSSGTDWHGRPSDTFSITTKLTNNHIIKIMTSKKTKTKEVVLRGGRNNHVIKEDALIKRDIKGNQKLFKDFFQFLTNQNFTFIPKYFGERNNQNVFEYTKGFVPENIGRTNITQLKSFMKIIRQMHDLSIIFTKSNKVVCHGDLSPCNVVFEDDKIKAIIDWDSIYIGDRHEDISYILWLWVNIGSHHKPIDLMINEIKQALDAYGSGLIEFRKNLAHHLVQRMKMVGLQIQKSSPFYENIQSWVNESIDKIEKNKKLFINI